MRTTAKLLLTTLVLAGITLAAAADEPTHEYFTTSDGIKIHYMRLGQSGSPVILVHGYTGSAEGNWFRNGIAVALAKNHRVVAIDCRNHGRSDKPQPRGPGQVGGRDRADGSPEDREGAPPRLLDGRLDHRPHPGRASRAPPHRRLRRLRHPRHRPGVDREDAARHGRHRSAGGRGETQAAHPRRDGQRHEPRGSREAGGHARRPPRPRRAEPARRRGLAARRRSRST